MTEQHKSSEQSSKLAAAARKAPAATATAPAPAGPAVSQAAAGPLTVRDLAVLASVVIIFVASVIPLVNTLIGSLNLWSVSGLFYIGIGVVLPLTVGGLFLARRLSPEIKVRVGSLSVDQFASVIAAFATYFFFIATVTNFDLAYLVGLIGALLLLVSTVCARWIPVFASDFADRAEVPAHIVARDAIPAVKRPAAPKPVAPQAAGQNGAAPAGAAQASVGEGAAPVSVAEGAALAGASDNQGATGWNAPQLKSGHTSAGQIFTPARDTAGAGSLTTASAASGAASSGAATAGVKGAGAAAGATAAALAGADQDGAAQASAKPSLGITDSNDPSAPTAAATAQGDANAVGLSGAAHSLAAEGQNTGSGQTSSPDATDASVATTLNPQVAAAKTPGESAPERESITATVNPSAPRIVAEPFWFAVDRPQNVIDERTRQFVFKLMPGAWILALEDRGTSFLVQDSHGKTGVLLDLVGIERASDSQ